MMSIALLSAHPAAALPVTGADLVLYVVVAAIVGVTGLLVRRATAREHLSTIHSANEQGIAVNSARDL